MHSNRIERKEFSNDPTAEMQEISTSFEGNVGAINKDLANLKKDCEAYGQVIVCDCLLSMSLWGVCKVLLIGCCIYCTRTCASPIIITP